MNKKFLKVLIFALASISIVALGQSTLKDTKSQILSNTIDSGAIIDNSITNADINASANISGSKVAAATSSTPGTVTRETALSATCALTVSFTTAGTSTYGPVTCYYYRVGRMVFMYFYISISKGTASGSLTINGVPITGHSTASGGVLNPSTNASLAAGAIPVGYVDGTSIRFYKYNPSAGSASQFNAADLPANSYVAGFAIYFANI